MSTERNLILRLATTLAVNDPDTPGLVAEARALLTTPEPMVVDGAVYQRALTDLEEANHRLAKAEAVVEAARTFTGHWCHSSREREALEEAIRAHDAAQRKEGT